MYEAGNFILLTDDRISPMTLVEIYIKIPVDDGAVYQTFDRQAQVLAVDASVGLNICNVPHVLVGWGALVIADGCQALNGQIITIVTSL